MVLRLAAVGVVAQQSNSPTAASERAPYMQRALALSGVALAAPDVKPLRALAPGLVTCASTEPYAPACQLCPCA